MTEGLDHIGIAVEDLDRAIRTYKMLFETEEVREETLAERNLKVAFLKVGGVTIELIMPTSEESAVSGFLRKRGEGLHHLAFRTDDLDVAAEALRKKSFTLAQGPAEGAHGTRVLFLHPKDSHGVLIELVQNV
jgi:methylmalonyl-CoA/ethylmalonyl-CoA epimerase